MSAITCFVVQLLALGAFAAPAVDKTLRFSRDGTFQISVFNDLHYGEAENLDWGPVQDINTTRVMNEVLDKEFPQLVVLNGDLITGENTYLHNSTHYVDKIVAPLVQRKLLWASTYGNHDSDFNLSRSGILAREQRYPYALTKPMFESKDAAVSNYYLPVYPYGGKSGYGHEEVPEVILWFFDSRGGNYFQETQSNGDEVPQPNWVDESVAEWFTKTNAQLVSRYRKTIPSLAFYHIPVNAMLAFQNRGVDPHREPGINDDNPLAQQGLTSGQGDVQGVTFNYTGQDIPFMKAMLGIKGLIATFSGHDHGDDWCNKWDSKLPGMDFAGNGLNLCFGRHTGYGGYGTWTRGSRQVVLDQKLLAKKAVESWVRLEDGTVSGRVTLNATYGTDEYPAVADTFT
ncbi:Metallo-dependent phosphatase [Rhizodiscina lignyota]|uniref:Metallo-dependent phosphatase n=1 Tax=Rhizodiscina lignyota TaxID=1504668 RepID=A0A9P4I5Z8_9PEZI|nr:Metallo-dependent phosphatase [Rhizodiscina lignyota]